MAHEAERLLAGVLADIRVALCPEDPESVQIGPVDFGTNNPSCASVPGSPVEGEQ